MQTPIIMEDGHVLLECQGCMGCYDADLLHEDESGDIWCDDCYELVHGDA